MKITYGASSEKLKKATIKELEAALLTPDGCGEKLKKEILKLLIEKIKK